MASRFIRWMRGQKRAILRGSFVPRTRAAMSQSVSPCLTTYCSSDLPAGWTLMECLRSPRSRLASLIARPTLGKSGSTDARDLPWMAGCTSARAVEPGRRGGVSDRWHARVPLPAHPPECRRWSIAEWCRSTGSRPLLRQWRTAGSIRCACRTDCGRTVASSSWDRSQSIRTRRARQSHGCSSRRGPYHVPRPHRSEIRARCCGQRCRT